MGAASTPVSCVYASLSLSCPVLRPAVTLGVLLTLDLVVRSLVVPGSSSGVLGPSVGLQFPMLPGVWETSRSSRSRLWIRFSSSHFWSFLHWRHLSGGLPASVVDCCLSSLRAGVCSHLWQRRVPARVLMVAWLPLPQVWRSAPSYIPLMLCASTGSPVNPGLS